MVSNSGAAGLRLLMVVLVELMNIQTAASLVHVDVAVHGGLDLDGLGAVALLRVQLAPVHWLDVHDVALVVLAARVVRRRDNRLSGRVETEVGLVHKLLIEARVHSRVVVLDSLVSVMASAPALAHLCSVLEQLVQD